MRENRFTFLLSSMEYDQLNRLADHLHRGRSDLLRWLILIHSEKEGISLRPENQEDILYASTKRRY
ncbi:hypothetical protein KQH61_00670 [bacterium]|nr:hypothetical protein [bacterium]